MRRGAIPPGKAGLVVLAAAAIPVVIGAAKPLARAVGRGLSKIGEKLQEAAAEAKKSNGAPPPPSAPSVQEDVVIESVAEVVQEPVDQAEPVVEEPEAAPPPEPVKEPKKPKTKAEKAAKKKPAARKRPPAPEDFETA